METQIKMKASASQPDVCRCCLAASGTWDLTVAYTSGAGIKIYKDMLQECFGVTLSHLTVWGSSRLACGMCVKLLQEAFAFRRQVLEAERQFLEYWNGIGNLSVKTEDDNQHHNIFEDSPTFNHDDNRDHLELNCSLSNSENHVFSQRQSTKRKQERKPKVKTKKMKKKIGTEYECDSDTPIAGLSNKNCVLNEDNNVTTDIQDHFEQSANEKHLENVGECFKEQIPLSDIKQVSERKRVILTCGIVLKDTTACPFRHHKSWFQCFFCSQEFMEINLLRNHMLQSHANIDEHLKNIKRYPRSLQIDISDLKCRQCDLSLSDVESMKRHFETIHQKLIYKECIADYKVNASPYTCHICKREFHVFRTLTTHLNEHYANCICDVCGKSFINSKRLKVHKRTHENGTYPCTECGKILKTKSSKANHMESAHSKRIVKCQICFKPMKHYNDRIKHMSEVHNITHKFKCSICSCEYNIKHYLATHMRQTHGHKNKKCLECGMAFITNHGLKKHMLKHSGEKPYTCSICSKSYVRSYTLREHMRIHETENKILRHK